MLIYYTVCGTIKSTSDNKHLKVSGSIAIDDTLRTWAGSSNIPADPAPLPLENAQYSYFISDYLFTIYSFAAPGTSLPNLVYSFSGNTGSLYMERAGGELGDLMWFLDDGSGNWTKWTGENFFCYHEDLATFDLFNEMQNLAPIIRLTSLDYLQNDTILNPPVITDILLTKKDAPTTLEVPETDAINLA